MSCDKPPSPLAPADNPAVIAHLNMVQGVINRLATQSASCKTWCLTVVGALVGLAGATKTPALVSLALLPVVVFAMVDASYLAYERAYRTLFNGVVEKVRGGGYALDQAYGLKAEVGPGDWWRSLTSWGVFPVYLSLVLAYLVALGTGQFG